MNVGMIPKVSIPFKREGIFQALVADGHVKYDDIRFQFPSNGKAYSKKLQLNLACLGVCTVSIPFKREGIFQD